MYITCMCTPFGSHLIGPVIPYRRGRVRARQCRENPSLASVRARGAGRKRKEKKWACAISRLLNNDSNKGASSSIL